MNDDTPTTGRPQGDDPAGEQPVRPEDPQAPGLRRSSSDRVLAGVAGGLGRYFGVDPVIFRIGFALSIFFGGLGALAYLLLAVFVPTDGDPDKAQRVGGRLQAMGFWRALGLIAIAALALVGLLALAVGAGVAAASDLDFRGGIGEREYHPLSAKSIPADGYRLGLGRLVVDLRDLDWDRERVVPLSVSLGGGQADVFVPERVCVTGSTHVGAGESEVAGERNDGFDVDHTAGAGSTTVPRLEIDADADVGQLRVINSDTADVDDPGYGLGPFHEDSTPQRAAEARACATG